MVTGPMPRKPKATRPKANTAGASMMSLQTLRAHQVADAHEHHDGEADVVGAEVAGHETGEDVERRSTLFGRGHDLLDVRRLGGGEDLDQFGDESAGQRAHADDDRQHPPVVAVRLADVGAAADEQVGHHEGQDDGHDRGEPDQRGQRGLEVHLVGVLVARLGDGGVEEVRAAARDDHHDAHGEDPHQERDLDERAPDTARMMKVMRATPVTP